VLLLLKALVLLRSECTSRKVLAFIFVGIQNASPDIISISYFVKSPSHQVISQSDRRDGEKGVCEIL
jgi:hypothetical protein